MSLNPSFTELYVVDEQVFPAIEVSDPELQLVTPQKEIEFKDDALAAFFGSIVMSKITAVYLVIIRPAVFADLVPMEILFVFTLRI